MKLLIIDGNSIMNRAFYGIKLLSNKKGFHTNAIFGFMNILFKHLKDHNPDKICVAFDVKAPLKRNDIYAEYKAGRKPMPGELREQFPVIKQILDLMSITRIEKEGIEADDIIGIIAEKCVKLDYECIIVSGDRDCLQLVGEKVNLVLAVTKSNSSDDDIYDLNKIKDKFNLIPSQLIDLKAIMGDSSDNIPGVPGIGEKGALALLQEFGNLDNIYANLDKIKGSVKEKLVSGKDSAYISKELGIILKNGDIGTEIDKIGNIDIKYDEFYKLLTELEMYSFIKKISESNYKQDKKINDKQDISIDVITEIYDKNVHSSIFNTEKIFLLNDDAFFTVLYENKIVNIEKNADIYAKLSEIPIITHDAKPLIIEFLKHSYHCKIDFDTMLGAYILNPSSSSYDLSQLCLEYLNSFAENRTAQLVLLPQIYEKMVENLTINNQLDLYFGIELPLCSVLADMENTGFLIDKNSLIIFGEQLQVEINELISGIYSFSNKEFNINSPKQLGEILFEQLGLKSQKRTKTGYSTDNDVLESLISEHPIVELIIQFRKLTKLKSTYVDGLLSKIEQDGRIHTIFMQAVTQTGRISSIEPNLQNIPVRTELGRQLRKFFIAKDGYVLSDADYSQIELRILAHIADDSGMQQAFIENKDIHTKTASQVFNIPINMVNSELRRRAKAVNFGIVYGIGAYSLSQDIGVSLKDAKNYIENYLNTYSGVKDYIENIINYAKINGYVTTIFNRRRYIPEINSPNKNIIAFGERISMNTPIQGTAADLIKLAMVNVYKRLNEMKLKSKLILQVHDELIIETHIDEIEQVKEILKFEMENAKLMNVPIIADVKIGKNWYETKE